MAKVSGGLSRALLIHPTLDLSKTRLIGWGAGQAFRDYFPHLNLPLEYTVCPRPENRGKRIHGVEVRGPDALLQEDPRQILVVVMAAFHHEVMHQIRTLNPAIRVVTGYSFETNSDLVQELHDFAASMDRWQIRAGPNSNLPARIGIFIQGPIHEFTPLAIAYNRLRHPGAHLCLVTWTTEPEDRVDRCRPWVDKIIAIDPPNDGCHDTRNLIARSCRVGSEHMLSAGVEYVVRARSDAVLTGSLNETLRRLYGRHGDENQRRLGAYLATSWKYIPFHYSDKLVIARARDMAELFSLPEDTRPPEFFSIAASDHFLRLKDIAWESRLWSSYARFRGYPNDTLVDAYRFARAELVELDSSFGMFSLKHMPMFDLDLRTELTPSIEWWNTMKENFDEIEADAERVSRSEFTIADFFAKKVGP